jgi:hypothetical protein
MKKALMIVAIITLVIIAGSMVYYFAFLNPDMQRQDLAFQKSNKLALDNALKEEDVNFYSSLIGIEHLTTEEYALLFKIHQDTIDNLYKQYGK